MSSREELEVAITKGQRPPMPAHSTFPEAYRALINKGLSAEVSSGSSAAGAAQHGDVWILRKSLEPSPARGEKKARQF